MNSRHFYAVEIDISNGETDIHAFERLSARDNWVVSGAHDRQKFLRKAITAKEADDRFRNKREVSFIRHDQELDKEGKRECSRS